ncbi:MAG TPA: SH3 domain-containing protein [Thermoanaerobaculia bacterium]|nr:SH3 domain-containing protein [Thermoanaerobaculia bacterium]
MPALARLTLAALLLLGAAADERVSAPAGTRVFEAPDAASRRLAVVDEDTELPVLETRGAWTLVRYSAYKGWIRLDMPESEPPPRFAGPDELARLARARRGIRGARESSLGPLRLVTDVPDGPLLAFLSRVAAALPEAYAARFGVSAAFRSSDTVVVFAREEDYASFEDEEPVLAGLRTRGHAGRTAAFLVAGARERDEVAALLVHELTHLLNKDAFPADLPPWLEEGMAEELSYGRIGEDGRLDPSTLRARRRRTTGESQTPEGRVRWVRYDVFGPEAMAGRLAARVRRHDLIPLAELLALSPARFGAADARKTTYPQSAFFIRYLLEGERGALAERFREFLAAAAAGAAPSAPALARQMEKDVAALEHGSSAWLLTQERGARP